MSFLLLLMSSLQQNWRRGQNRFCLEARGLGRVGGGRGQGEEMAQTMYAHMNKWIKKRIKLGWWTGSSGRANAYQTWVLEFKPQYHKKKKKLQWFMLAILATQEVDIRRIKVWGQSWAKTFKRSCLNRKRWVWWHTDVIPATAGSINNSILVHTWVKSETQLKINHSHK
jgi:hypothetical protein